MWSWPASSYAPVPSEQALVLATACTAWVTARRGKAKQMKKRFGSQGSYLVDFYHVCEYLSAAGKAIQSDPKACAAWLDKQKARLKGDGLSLVLGELQSNLEPPEIANEQAPVRQCHRYLSARQDQLDYAQAMQQELPIGSGEIESAHRHVVQKRLKLPGAWWEASNAEHMLALRLSRVNKEWSSYWATNYHYAEAA